jgi:hypothetical protein
MKTNLKSYMVLVLGLFAFSCIMGQKTASEYDDMYYRPSDKQVTQQAEKQEIVTPQIQSDEPDDYEKYINSIENQRLGKTELEYSDDTLEYKEDPNYVGGEYYEKDGNTYITNNYYNPDEYYYTSRIRRFYDPYYSFGYFNSWYYDPYWYEPGWSFGMSFGYPYWGLGLSYGWPSYYSWYYPYNSWYYPYDYYYGYYGYSPYRYNTYWNGYYNGYYYGYYDQYYDNHRPVYYGPRRTIEANRSAVRGGVTSSINGRRVSPTTTGTGRVATGNSGTYGRRTASDGTSTIRSTQDGGVMKSTSTTRSAATVRRPYQNTTGSSSGNTQERKSTSYSKVSPQDRPVYTRPSSTTSQSRPSYGTTDTRRSGSYSGTSNRSTTYSRPSSSATNRSGSSTSVYSRPSSSSRSTPSYSRPSSSSSPSYSRPSSSSGSFSSGSRSSSSSSHSSGSSSAPHRR